MAAFLVSLYNRKIETQQQIRTRTGTWKRRALLIAIPLAVLYAAGFAAFSYAMRRPPDTFARVMKRVGPAPMLLFPFESMWTSARAGHLNVGEQAPDFTLPLLDHSGNVTLSSLRGVRPVVLIFGSYT